MSRVKTFFECAECEHQTPKWVGQCPECGGWSTMSEQTTEPAPATAAAGVPPEPLAEAAVLLADLTGPPVEADPTGIEEFDRVFGGGLVPGSVTLISGDPGVGKSTLVLQVAATVSRMGPVLYVSGEESVHQIRGRAERLGIGPDQLWLASLTDLPQIAAEMAKVTPRLVVVDSIQTVRDPQLGAAAGSVAQVKACTVRLVALAKNSGAAVIVIGHVTKDGVLAGPRVLEHLVDTVAALDGDRHDDLRLLRTSKHRFGSTHELGVFEMTREGLLGVPDTSGRLLGDRRLGAAGSTVAAVVEGSRAVMVEVQALVGASVGGAPRRSAHGLDQGRLNQLLAVLDKRCGYPFGGLDVYVSVVGGLRVKEPAADMAIAAAVVSSLLNRPLPADAVCWGEVGLGGEIRQVSRPGHRVAEASRMGFRRAVVPSATVAADGVSETLRLANVGSVFDALDSLELIGTAV